MTEAKWGVGEIVYSAYRPQRPGKVVEVLYRTRGTAHTHAHYLVNWGKSEVTEHWELDLSSLNDLIADHEKKLNGHKKRLEKAQKEL